MNEVLKKIYGKGSFLFQSMEENFSWEKKTQNKRKNSKHVRMDKQRERVYAERNVCMHNIYMGTLWVYKYTLFAYIHTYTQCVHKHRRGVSVCVNYNICLVIEVGKIRKVFA